MIQRPRLHVIDNDIQFCESIKENLKNFFLISVSNGGMEGYSFALSQRPDIFLISQDMQGWDGVRPLVAIREQPKLKNIPVLMVIGDPNREIALAVFSAGANGCLRKDQIRDENLIERLRELLPASLKNQRFVCA